MHYLEVALMALEGALLVLHFALVVRHHKEQEELKRQLRDHLATINKQIGQ
jgi:Flp pilus assembly protein TadB